MNLRLQSLLAQAESLPDDAKDRLADAFERGLRAEGVARILSPEEVEALDDLLARFDPDEAEPTDEEVTAWAREQAEEDVEFTPQELEHLDRIAAEPFVEADPALLARLFAHRG